MPHLNEQLDSGGALDLLRRRRNYDAGPVADDQEALAFQKPVRPGNRVQVDPEVTRKLAHRGESRPCR